MNANFWPPIDRDMIPNEEASLLATTLSFSFIISTGYVGILSAGNIVLFPIASYIGTLLSYLTLTPTNGASLSVSHISAENEFSGNSGTKIVNVGICSLTCVSFSALICFESISSRVRPQLSFSSFIKS